MIPAIFGAEGGLAAREGASSGEHSRRERRAGWLEGRVGFAFDDVARVTDSGEAEGRFSSSDQALRRPEQFASRTKTLGDRSNRDARNDAGTDVSAAADVHGC